MAWKQWNKTSFPYICDVAKYKIIIRKIEEYLMYPDYNLESLSYYVKELLENGQLYVSCAVANRGASKIFSTSKLKLYNKADLHDRRKMNTCNIKYSNIKRVRWEHVVPTNVILEHVLWLYKQDRFSFWEYIKIKNMCGKVCLVTKKEDDKLTAAGYRQAMPAGKSIYDVWSRYNEVGIKIY